MTDDEALRRQIRTQWDSGELGQALAGARELFRRAPDELHAKVLLARLLQEAPDSIEHMEYEMLERLVRDKDIDPSHIGRAGWRFLRVQSPLFRHAATTDAALAAELLEGENLAHALLEETPVTDSEAEALLAGVRRWLLLSGRSHEFPKSLSALAAQTAINGGAWFFDAEERAALSTGKGAPLRRLYTTAPAHAAPTPGFEHSVTRAVASQYEGWPYPQWRRVTRMRSSSLADEIRKIDPDGIHELPDRPDILIAGCGTGRQAALAAQQYNGANILGIDISEASLAYARERLEVLQLPNVEMRLLDLHDVAKLNRRFDFITSTGVLHHLPDPEKGWEVLLGVLKPGGVLHIMIYSKIARMRVRAWRQWFEDLQCGPVDDDVLRAVRQRIIAMGPKAIPISGDFYTLAGVHDLLLHRHENPFDVAQIKRAIERFGLEFLGFRISKRPLKAKYLAENPHDKLFRDYDAWQRFELKHPTAFAAMYDFRCRKSAA
ncbi:MAG TPA: class I SAM-dependent methyltransferase [Terracidiphilus sp.]|nr:class I SAM-dependent methyltransferase [Terracidiphilus sp.]